MTQRNRPNVAVPPTLGGKEEVLEVKKEPEPDSRIVGFDHTVPYPAAPAVDHNDMSQEHYSGARDPELAKKPAGSDPFPRNPPFRNL